MSVPMRDTMHVHYIYFIEGDKREFLFGVFVSHGFSCSSRFQLIKGLVFFPPHLYNKEVRGEGLLYRSFFSFDQ